MPKTIVRRWAIDKDRDAFVTYWADGEAVLTFAFTGADMTINLNYEECAGLAAILAPPKREAFDDEKAAT